ncbi:hypothetical protein Pd630_LPD17034 (plasmid) [Rhodococcus opacus PD630]|nr:hypothetical protein Pd630_LPD17034 [Rhodococcus opacus PD630]
MISHQVTGLEVIVGMAETGRDEFHAQLVLTRLFQVDVDDLELAGGFSQHSGPSFHDLPPCGTPERGG